MMGNESSHEPGGDAAPARSAYEAIVADLVATSPATSGVMFGMPCLKVNGKAFAGFTAGMMVFKLGTPEHAEALALPGAQLFDPSGRGRPMREWVRVPGAHAARWGPLAHAAYRFVAGAR
jgi:hypothetical protein